MLRLASIAEAFSVSGTENIIVAYVVRFSVEPVAKCVTSSVVIGKRCIFGLVIDVTRFLWNDGRFSISYKRSGWPPKDEFPIVFCPNILNFPINSWPDHQRRLRWVGEPSRLLRNKKFMARFA